MPDELDNKHLQRLRLDDPSAMEDLFMAYHPLLCSFANNITRDKELAKDVVQEVFIKLWNTRRQLMITSSLRSYLIRATINTALNSIKSLSRTRKVGLEKVVDSEVGQSEGEQQLHLRELEQATHSAIHELPERTRKVFLLIRTEELSYAEVAAELQISVKAVEKEMMKALRLLREKLKPYLSNPLIFIWFSHFL